MLKFLIASMVIGCGGQAPIEPKACTATSDYVCQSWHYAPGLQITFSATAIPDRVVSMLIKTPTVGVVPMDDATPSGATVYATADRCQLKGEAVVDWTADSNFWIVRPALACDAGSLDGFAFSTPLTGSIFP